MNCCMGQLAWCTVYSTIINAASTSVPAATALPLPPSLPPFATPPSQLRRSLGVTLWELCSFASWPYEDMLNEEVVEHVKNKPKCVLENPDEGGPLQEMWECTYRHTHRHTQMYTYTHTQTHMHNTHKHPHTHAQHTQTHTRTTHTYTHTHNTHTYTHMHNTHTCTHIHIHTHTCTTHTHTYALS